MATFPPGKRDAYKELGERLRIARLESGRTQEAVAAEINRPQTYVSRIEGGQQKVDVVELAYFAALYGKPLTFFDVTDKYPLSLMKNGPTATQDGSSGT